MNDDGANVSWVERLLAHGVGGVEMGNDRLPPGVEGARLLARAQAAIGCAPPRLATLVVTATGTGLEARTGDGRPGEVAIQAPIRGPMSGGVLMHERLGDRKIGAHVEVGADGGFRIQLDLGPDAVSRRLRVTLLRDQREVVSEAARQGRMCLPELAPGRWRVRLQDLDGWLGDIDLVLSRAEC